MSQHVVVVTEPNLAYRLLQGVIRSLLRLLTRYRVTGLEHYPSSGAYIVVFNHLHWMDIPVIFTTLQHSVAAMVAAKWQDHPVVGFLARHVGHAIFVQRGQANTRSLAEAMHWVQGGGVLLVSPEGTRSPAGLAQGMRGTAFVAARTGVPVVPVGAWGHEHTFRQLRRLARPTIEIHIGTPIHLAGTPNHARGADLDAYTDTIMGAIAALVPEAYRGTYRAAPSPMEPPPEA